PPRQRAYTSGVARIRASSAMSPSVGGRSRTSRPGSAVIGRPGGTNAGRPERGSEPVLAARRTPPVAPAVGRAWLHRPPVGGPLSAFPQHRERVLPPGAALLRRGT